MKNDSSAQLELDLLQIFPATGKLSVDQVMTALADRGKPRTKRTVQRRLAELVKAGLLDSDAPAKPLGFRRVPLGRPWIVAGMKPADALFMSLADAHLAPLLPPDVKRAVAPFTEAARRHVADQGHGKGGRWLDKVRVVPPGPRFLPPVVEETVMSACAQALHEDRWLSIDYVNAKEERRNFRVMPLAMVQQGVVFYLVVRFERGEAPRLLAMHRVQAAHCGADRFERPDSFDLDEYLDQDALLLGNGRRVRLSFELDAKVAAHFRDLRLSEDQTLTRQGSHVRIEATVVESVALDHWLRGFGDRLRHLVKTPLP